MRETSKTPEARFTMGVFFQPSKFVRRYTSVALGPDMTGVHSNRNCNARVTREEVSEVAEGRGGDLYV